MKTAAIVINKWWEADPVVNAILHAKLRAETVPWPTLLNHPRRRPLQTALPVENLFPSPRVVLNMPTVSVAVWCVSDLLEHLPDQGKFQSSSQRKAQHLAKCFAYEPDCVIAVGTAAHPDMENGRVMIGSQVFMHNYHPEGANPDSNWSGGNFDRVIPSSIRGDTFKALTTFEPSVAAQFLPTPNLPASPKIVALQNGVSLGTINVTNYSQYAAADQATLDAFNASGCTDPPLSVETTHGLIRSMSSAPFVFVSAIVNQLGRFDSEVRPHEYAQNAAAAHNAGVVVTAILHALNSAAL